MDYGDLETRKLEAEIQKLEAEALSYRRTSFQHFADVAKVVGAMLAALAAGYAAFETYRVTQVETKLANFEKQRALSEKAAAEQQLAEASARAAYARKDLAELEAAVARAQIQLAKAKEAANNDDVVRSLDLASASLRNAQISAPNLTMRIRFLLESNLNGQRLTERIAEVFIDHGFSSAYVERKSTFIRPPKTLVVYARDADRSTAVAARDLLLAQRISADVIRRSLTDGASPATVEIQLGSGLQ